LVWESKGTDGFSGRAGKYNERDKYRHDQQHACGVQSSTRWNWTPRGFQNAARDRKEGSLAFYNQQFASNDRSAQISRYNRGFRFSFGAFGVGSGARGGLARRSEPIAMRARSANAALRADSDACALRVRSLTWRQSGAIVFGASAAGSAVAAGFP